MYTFNFAMIFHQYCTTFTFPPLKSIIKHLFIMSHKVIPFFLTFNSSALHKYTSTSSLSKPSKFLILQFLVKFYKLHSVFKFLPKSHMSFQVRTINVYINYDFILSKILNGLIIKIKKLISTCSIVSRVFIYASNKSLSGTLTIDLGKNSICLCYCKLIKTSFARIK